MNIRLLLLFSTLLTISNGYKVLFLGPFNGKSHFLYLQSFVRALLDRGHEVTYLTSQSLSHLNLANYTEVLIDPPFDIYQFFPQELLLQMNDNSPFTNVGQLSGSLNIMNDHAFQSANVQKFIHSTDLHFDVIINEEFWGDSFLMFAHKFKAPIITMCPFGTMDSIDEQMGLMTPLSIAAHWMLPYSDNMTFYQRWYNAALTAYDWYIRKFYHIPAEEAIAKKYFGHLGPLPSIDDLKRSVSVNFVNLHRALSHPRPAMPGTVSIGGAHIKKSNKPLPNDLQKFLDESKNGVIYFSLGTDVQSSKLPKEKIQAFLDAFRGLKQKVLWKFEDDSLTNIPSNVMIRKWMPQNNFLAHKNVVLFISHGGLFGTSESLYHGVPLLLIPFFGDQTRNAHKITWAGYGDYLTFDKLTKDSLTSKIHKLTSDESYLARAKHSSAIFKDNVIHPMDEAMFWIEHVCKFKGAKHLKSHAVNMSWFTYLLLDVILFNIAVVVVAFYLVRAAIRMMFSKKTSNFDSHKKGK